MRRFDWGFGIGRPRQGKFYRAGVVLFTALGLLTLSAAVDPAAANRKYAAIVIDGKTGEVLFSRKADYRRYPASLTKVMTLYLLFEALEEGKIKLTDKIPISRHAASMPPSKLGLKPGEKISVEKAIKALIVRSANDVASAVGEKLGGTEFKFALKMTKKAKAIGMKRTRFRNASGLYNRKQVTTARDMATLALRIQKDFPQYYRYFQSMEVSWKGRTWQTHNRLMKYFPGADGLKTGYIRASGFNLITSARRGNMHLVGVVMGGRKSRTRDRHMVNILERNFARLLKRPEYVYPIADRLPELRPKPNFAAIEAEEWLQKKLGVVPRPNPFARDTTKEPPTVVAERAASPPGSTEDSKNQKVAAGPERSGPGRGDDNSAKTAQPEDGEPARARDRVAAKSEAEKPVLAASGSGTLPAGRSTVPITTPKDTPSGEEDNAAAAAVAQVPARRPSENRQLAAATPPPSEDESPQDAIARLIEEGDGQVASADLAGQIPAGTSGESTGETPQEGKTVQLASAGPAAAHTAGALLRPDRQWGVQVGAFTSLELAEIHLDNAERLQPDVLTRERSALVPKEDPSGKLYRARFGPMEKEEAEAACKKLKDGGMHCFALETDDWGEAVRR